MLDNPRYTYHEDESARSFIHECITSGFSHIGVDVLESFERKMSESRDFCLAGGEVDISTDVAKLLRVLEEEAQCAVDRLFQNAPSPHEDIRGRRFYIEEHLPRELRTELDAVVRQHWLEIIDLTSKAIYKHLRLFPYCVQVCAALSMLQGKAAEMLTGEGKTIVGPLVAVPLALRNRIASTAVEHCASDSKCYLSLGLHPGELRPAKLGSLHFVTSDDYLVLRDYSLLEPVYAEFGISTAYILDGTLAYERHLAYRADVVFGTASRFGWDYLESLSQELGADNFLRSEPIAIVDEIDHGLIDESSTSFQLGGMGPEHDGARMLVYQVHRFFQQLEDISFVRFDEEKRALALTELGANLIDGWFGTVENRVAAILQPGTALGDALDALIAALDVDVRQLRSVTDKVSLERIEGGKLINPGGGTGELWVDPANPWIRQFCDGIAGNLSERFLDVVGVVVRALSLVADRIEAIEFAQWSDWVECMEDHEKTRTAVRDALCRLLAMGLTRIASDPEALLRLQMDLDVVKRIKPENRESESGFLCGLGSQSVVRGLSSLFRTLVIQPFYPALLERNVRPRDMSPFLHRLGETIEYAIRETPAYFSQWVDEIPDRYLRPDLPEGEIGLSEAGAERLVEYLESLFKPLGAKQDRHYAELHLVANCILSEFDPMPEQVVSDQEAAWQDWWEQADSSVSEPLRKELADLKSRVLRLASDLAGQATNGGPSEKQFDALATASSALLTRLDEVGAPPELCSLTEQLIITSMDTAAMRLIITGKDIACLGDFARLLARVARVEKLETEMTINLLAIAYVAQISCGRSVSSLFGRERASGRVNTSLRESFDAFDVLFDSINVAIARPVHLGTMKDGISLREMLHSQFSDQLEFIDGCLGILVLGQHMPVETLIENQWLKQALYGYLDELKQLGLLELYDANFAARVLEQCFRMESYKEGEHYVIRDITPDPDRHIIDPYTKDEVTRGIAIVDQPTGRISPGSRWSGLLHEVLEASHNMFVRVGGTHRSVTMQSLASTIYKSVTGMSGTLKDVADELREIYGIKVDSIPPNRPCVRIDHSDAAFHSKEEALESLAERVAAVHAEERPILIRCVSISESERVHDFLSERLSGAEIRLLNGRPMHANKEASVIATAGSLGSIVVSTQIVGRGVDIKLEDSDRGLYAFGFERQPFARWDLQFAGRAGRQGDVGDSLFLCTYEHLFGGRGTWRASAWRAPADPDWVRSEVAANQLRRSRDARAARRFQIQRGHSIQRVNSAFADRRCRLAARDRACRVCRDGHVEHGKSTGVCSRCVHCLGKIRSSGQACKDKFCVSERPTQNYYVWEQKRDSCVWSSVHEEFLRSDNPSLFSSVFAEAIKDTHEQLLSEATDWHSYIASESLFPERWATRFDRYYLTHVCRVLFECDLDVGRLELMEREFTLPGAEPVKGALTSYLRQLIGVKGTPDQCPWRHLLRESHAKALDAAKVVYPVFTDERFRVEPDSLESMLSPRDVLQFLSTRLFGGAPVRPVQQPATQIRYSADELELDRCVGADQLSRMIGIACLDDAWDEWYRRLDDIEDSMYDLDHGTDTSEFELQADRYAKRYLCVAQLRMVDCIIRVCRLAELPVGEDNTARLSRLLTPLCDLLGWDYVGVIDLLGMSDDPLAKLLGLAISSPEEAGLLRSIEAASELHEGGKLL